MKIYEQSGVKFWSDNFSDLKSFDIINGKDLRKRFEATSKFIENFNNDVDITPDKLEVPAMRPDERTQSIYYSTLVNTGIITPNEARVGLGFPSIDGEDGIRVPQNITGSATDATQGGRPPTEESEIPVEEGTSDEG